MSRLLFRTVSIIRPQSRRIAFMTYISHVITLLISSTRVTPVPLKEFQDPYVNNAINSQGRVTTYSEHSADIHAEKHVEPELEEIDIKVEERRQWQWSVAEELLPSAKEKRSKEILDQVGRMEVGLDGVGERVKQMKEHLDVLEEEGGVVLHVKDS